MNELYVIGDDLNERIIERYRHGLSLAELWRRAKRTADRLFGPGQWQIKRDSSLPGGYIVAQSGDCLLLR